MNGEPGFTLHTAMPSLYGQVGEDIEEDHADPPNDPNYVNAPKISCRLTVFFWSLLLVNRFLCTSNQHLKVNVCSKRPRCLTFFVQ